MPFCFFTEYRLNQDTCARFVEKCKLTSNTYFIERYLTKWFFCSFIRRDALDRHMVIHTGERPYKCKECTKPYNQILNLKNHYRSHTGEKPYQCKFCNRSFSHPTPLKVHIRTHTGERPYK